MSKTKIAVLGATVVLSAVGIGGITASADSIQSIAATAVPVANQYGLYPSVMIAQALLESGSGANTSSLATDYNNYFGVKYTSGQAVDLPTTEYVNGQAETLTQSFQVYNSAYDSFVAQAQLLSNYYPGTLVANTSSYLDALNALQGRYATDPNYASLLNQIIQDNDLTAYDDGSNYIAPAVSSALADNYVVKPGDTLSGIAAANNISVTDLASSNGLNQNSLLQIGQSLSLSDVTSNAAASDTYTVQLGDSLWAIAQANGTSVANLASLNGLTPNSILQVGQTLNLPVSHLQSSPLASGIYTVQSGDTLWSIAQNSGHSVDELAQLNGLTNANAIAVGQVLSI